MPAFKEQGPSEVASPTWRQSGQQASLPISIKDLRQANCDIRLQATYPPMSSSTFGKTLSGTTCFKNPFHHNGNGFHTIHAENSPLKPRIVTVVRPGSKRNLRKITILLNRRSVQTFEQLLADISEALGFPRWKNDRVKRLFSLKGREIRSVSDFFRGDDVFIAAGREKLTAKDFQDVLEELYPECPYSQSIVQQNWEKFQTPQTKTSKADSGFHEEPIVTKQKGPKLPKQAATNLQRVRDKARQEERLKARRWERERWERQQKELSEKNRFKGRLPHRDEDIEKFAHIDLENASLCEKCKRNRGRREQCTLIQRKNVSPDKKAQGREEDQPEKLPLEKRRQKPKSSKMSEDNFQKEKHECEDTKKYRKESSWTCKEHGDMSIFHGQSKSEKTTELEDKKCAVEKQSARNPCDSEVRNENSVSERFLNGRPNFTENKSPDKAQTEKVSEDFQQKNVHKEGQREAETRKSQEEVQSSERESSRNCILKPRLVKTKSDIESYYEIGRAIGDGNFAVVKECKLRNTDFAYAMKIISKAKLKGKEHMIENEISIIKSLSHPNVVRLLQDYETESDIYLIMEIVQGGDLFDSITESVKFTEHNASLMVNDLCQALAYIHSKNIVHRDLKPENLLVQHNKDGSTTLKLADFGLAVVVTEPIFTVCGTPTYVAPEILSEKGYGLPVDMWATGVIVYILLCGFPPFRSLERDQEELFEIIQLGEYEFLSPYWDNISDGAKDLISKLLLVDPEKRYAAQQALQHPWVQSGSKNSFNLQREVTTNIERHFKNRRKREHASAADH
ncbi:serine/threonine-protein kinase DCLK3 isoform X1 [Lepisosteus oculatus]|uniref:serine/threonine-protein kinase DCLK3 isoform X1 n=1 Tax=Lepisosteus oculatus TaxID=7918 RepID=UPI0035F5096C